ncbi:MAG: hypothetical protein ABIQ88_02775 [Chitinophagaceae bacterium]
MKLPVTTGLLFIFIFSILPVKSVLAQSTPDDSLLYNKAVSHLVNLYHQSAGDQSGLFNGSQYGGYPFSFTEGNPFFREDKPGFGSVIYDGVLYEKLRMQFDEVKDVLFTQDSARRIQLLNERIDRFTLFNNNFIRIVKDTENTVLIRTGFYNLLYEGNTSLLKKEEKHIREDVSSGELRRFIDVSEYYYLKKNNLYYAVKSKRNLLDIFNDRKKDIKQFIAKNKLSYRKDKQNMLTQTTAYYDQLIK